MAQAVEWLAAGWGGEAPLDLANRLVVVPTRQAGRRLREALAEHASRRGQAVFPPRVMTPDALLTHGLPTGVAARIESLLAWVDVVREVDLADCRDVFPIDPPERNAAWALALGAEFGRLQVALGEGGLRMADVVGRVGAECPETERWRQLGALELSLIHI